MGRWLGAGIHDLFVGAFHIWTYLAAALASGLAAGATAWVTAWGKGFTAGRAAEKRRIELQLFERQRGQGSYHLETPRPPRMGPNPRPPPARHHIHRDHYH